MPATRSDSLCRSSPAPRIVVVPRARVAARHRTGISSMAAATSVGPRSMARNSEERTTRSAIGSPRSSSASMVGVGPLLDVRAHRAQEVDDRAPGRVDTDVAERELGIGMDGPGDEPERGRRDVGRHVLIDRLHRRPSFHRQGDALVARCPLDRDATCPQHALRVVARRDPFPDGRPTLGP